MSYLSTHKLFDEAIHVAGQLGFSVCQEILDGVGGTQPAVVQNEHWIVLDRQQPVPERLARLVQVLADNSACLPAMSPDLRALFPHFQRQAA